MRADPVKLWLDEARPAPDQSWTICRTVEAAKDHVRWGYSTGYPGIDAFSLDHDLSNAAIFELAPSGLGFVRWCIAHYGHGWPIGQASWEVHSQNLIGGGRMVYALWRAGYRVRWAPYHWPISWTFG